VYAGFGKGFGDPMGRYLGAVQRPLGKKTSIMAAPDLVCLHTMVGYLHSTDAYFRTVSVFSHFGIGGKWGSDISRGLDGVVYQWGDTNRRAAANLDGNDHIISVETADNAARPIQPWTDKQCDAIVDLLVWANRAHDIPLELVPDSKRGRRGVCYHRQGCDPYRVAGGELWSSSAGKDCPTQARIDQIPGLIDRARRIADGAQEEDDVTQEEVEAAVRKVLRLPDTGLAVPAGQLHNGNLAKNLTVLAQGNTNALMAVRAAQDAIRADQAVSGERESKALALLAEIEADLPEPTPEA
jgi:hypothetical protein